MPSSNQDFLRLARLGIGHSAEPLREPVDWNTMEALATKQGLLGVVLDGIQQLPEGQRPPKVQMLQWIGQVMQGYEQRYMEYRKAIDSLTAFYNAHDYKMMVLKGYACGIDWPKPEYRPYGDIDIWLFGKQKEADAVLARETGIKIDNSHHHHTVFNWMGITVENHYDFVNVHAPRSSAEMEKVFKKLGEDDTHVLNVNGGKVYLPSPNLHALFLIKHSVSHFVGANINLRQLLDWAFFVKKHGKEVDWLWLDGMLEKYHMKDFLNCLNAIFVENLGFRSVDGFDYQLKSVGLRELKEKVLGDIINPTFTSTTPGRFIQRMLYKYRRWKGNAWKQNMCYNESRWELFRTGLWEKLLKPASF